MIVGQMFFAVTLLIFVASFCQSPWKHLHLVILVLRCNYRTVLCEEIDVGESVVRTIASGIRPHYAAEDLINRKVCVLANLKDRNLAGFKSQVGVQVGTGLSL